MAGKTATLEIPTNDAARIEAAIRAYIAKIDQSLERNKRTQARIDKLKAETGEIRERAQARMKSLCGRRF